MRYLDLKTTLGAGILTKVDRASMAVALEVRPVFLHRDVLYLAGRVPARLLSTGTEAKALLRRAVRPWLPTPPSTAGRWASPCHSGAGWASARRSAALSADRPAAGLLDPAAVAVLHDAHSVGDARNVEAPCCRIPRSLAGAVDVTAP